MTRPASGNKTGEEKMNVLIATIKSWNLELAAAFKSEYEEKIGKIEIISSPQALTAEFLKEFQPAYLIFPHWSWIIPAEIYESYECIVFHMTDLPFGRGGSPLQNLLSRGIHHTKLSAIRVSAGLDTGPVYLKSDLDISEGSAEKIFRRAGEIIFKEMLPKILCGRLQPAAQTGTPITFARRTPAESEMKKDFDITRLYDHIRMLDGEGYPPAFLDFGQWRLEFFDAAHTENEVTAKVRWRKKNE